MRNKFGGICYRCGEWCEPGDGHFEKVRDANLSDPKSRVKWQVQHAECAIKYRGTNKRYHQAKT